MSHSFFVRNPEAFYEFYKEKMMFLEAEPNPAHEKLAQLEHVGKLTAVITQNIDGLHQAGRVAHRVGAARQLGAPRMHALWDPRGAGRCCHA